MQVLTASGSTGMTSASLLAELLRREGPGALWSGVTARVATIGPGAAISWAVYERMKDYLARS